MVHLWNGEVCGYVPSYDGEVYNYGPFAKWRGMWWCSTYKMVRYMIMVHLWDGKVCGYVPSIKWWGIWLGDVAPCGACRPWIFFINRVLCFLKINCSGMEKEERWLEMPLQGEDEWTERERGGHEFYASNEVWTLKSNFSNDQSWKNAHTRPLFIA